MTGQMLLPLQHRRRGWRLRTTFGSRTILLLESDHY